MPAFRIYIFLFCAILFACVSRRSILKPRSHGFVRFFVFILILGLVLRNLDKWFQNPGSLNQILSWILLVISLIWIFSSVPYLHSAKRAKRNNEPDLFHFERTDELIETGPFRLIRHPMYASLLFLAWGAGLKIPDGISLALVSIITGLTFVMARREELENVHYFGPVYRFYMDRTKRFVPFLFLYR